MKLIALAGLAACGRLHFDPLSGDGNGNRDATASPRAFVQHGTTTLSGSNASATVSAVDPAHAFLVFGVSGSVVDPANGLVTGTIADSTTLRFDRALTGVTLTIGWYVVEWAGADVQAGTASAQSGQIDILQPIAPVDLATSFPIISWRTTGTSFSGNDLVNARFAAPDMLDLSTTGGAGNLPDQIAWQVVSIPTATVVSGGATLATGVISASAFGAYPDNSALLARWTMADLTAGTGAGAMTAAGSVIELQFSRMVGGDPIDLAWFLVTIPGARIQTGGEGLGLGVGTLDVPLQFPVDTTRSYAFLAANERCGATGFVGAPPNDNAGVAWFNFDLVDATTLRLTRGAADAAAAANWYVVELPGHL